MNVQSESNSLEPKKKNTWTKLTLGFVDNFFLRNIYIIRVCLYSDVDT